MHRTSLVTQSARYLIVAVVAAIVDVGTLWSLNSLFSVHHLIAAAIGFLAGLVVNFMLARTWVFGAQGAPEFGEFSAYAAIGVVGVALTEVVMYVGVDLTRLTVMAAKAVALVLVFAWNFLSRRFLLYREATA